MISPSPVARGGAAGPPAPRPPWTLPPSGFRRHVPPGTLPPQHESTGFAHAGASGRAADGGTWDDNRTSIFYKQYYQRLTRLTVARVAVAHLRSADRPGHGCRGRSGGRPRRGRDRHQVEVATANRRRWPALSSRAGPAVAAGSALKHRCDAGGMQRTTAARAGDVLVTISPRRRRQSVTASTGRGHRHDGSMGTRFATWSPNCRPIASAVKSLPRHRQRWATSLPWTTRTSTSPRSRTSSPTSRAFGTRLGPSMPTAGETFPSPGAGPGRSRHPDWRRAPVARVVFWVGECAPPRLSTHRGGHRHSQRSYERYSPLPRFRERHTSYSRSAHALFTP